MTDGLTTRRNALARLGVAGLVGVVHIGLFILLGQVRTDQAYSPSPTPIIIDLVRPEPAPPPPPPPPPLRTPSAAAGGGAPSAPSVVRPARPRTQQPPVEITAPPSPAPVQPLVIGAAPTPSATTGAGQGGQGAGVGGGIGTGAGRGAGEGRFRLLRGPTMEELRRLHPPAAFRQRLGGRATLSCRIRLDTRLEDCRVVDESPPGMGFGRAALEASGYFRFQPPTRDGVAVEGQEVPVVVLWP
ncbi:MULTISPECIES: energy transducer TonB [unclassified Brevundimonas]|uniref:energy transducer TonB n=1 Tax=unclassified Brevundimonas TaxID=2622653 RepID=UPI0025B920D2|nr:MULTISPECIES: TonB family protein [unclassified Brevundimonas]